MTTIGSSGGRPRRRLRVPPVVREPAPKRFNWSAVAIVAGLATLAMFAWGWIVGTNAVGIALLEIPLLLLLTAPLFLRASKDDSSFDLGGLLALGLIVRFAGAYYRFTHASDGATYHLAGAQLAKSYRNLDFSADVVFPIPGTGGMRLIAGVSEVFTNGNSFATFLFFAWLSFLGCYCFYRALITALPDADLRRYAVLIMLWPSLVFWPSSIGKDSWVIFTLGIAALGAARVYQRLAGGYVLVAIGLLAGSLVRPHMMLLFAAAFAVSLAVGRRAERPDALTPASVAKFAGLVVVVVLGLFLLTQTSTVLDAKDIGASGSDGITTTTAAGNSSFDAPNPRTPIGLVEAIVTVPFRPFPFEASGTEALVTSFEGIALLVLIATSWRRLASIPRRLRREPYVTFAFLYVCAFIYAFGAVANFGILARQRSQLLPLLFVLLALAPSPRKERPSAPSNPPLRSPVRRPR